MKIDKYIAHSGGGYGIVWGSFSERMIPLQIYVVHPGDTLYRIARRFEIPMEELVYVNQLQAPGVLSVGQALLLPDPRTHTVKQGESLYTIGKQYRISLKALIEANPQLQDPDRLRVGQKIRLPTDTVGTRQVTVNGYFSRANRHTLEQSLPYLSFLSAFCGRADETGAITEAFDVELGLSKDFGVKNLLTVTNLREQGGFSSEIAHAILTDNSVQDRLVNNIFSLLEQRDFDGVNLDLEYVLPKDRPRYNQFLARLSDALHRRDYLLLTALAPKQSDQQPGLLYEAHDYAFHGQAADFTVLMCYEWGYTYGPAMAVAPLNMVKKVLDYAVQEIPTRKILLGIPNYGYDWTLPFRKGTAARALTNLRAVTLAGEVGAEIRFDPEAKAPFFRYAKEGRQHEVWFEDARSLQAKLDLAEEYDLAGVSFWNLNSLFRTNFLLLSQMYRIEKF